MKSNYIAFETYHERYYFSTEVDYYIDKTLEEVIVDKGYDINDKRLEKGNGFYIIDSTHKRVLSDTEMETYKVSGVDNIQPESLIIIDLNKLCEENSYNEFVWGKTNNKFGLLDRKED